MAKNGGGDVRLENLLTGMTVFSVQKRIMVNTKLRTCEIFDVRIVSVDLEKRTVVASWNNNAPQTYTEKNARGWRKARPLLVEGPFGVKRLATKEEMAAHKAVVANIKSKAGVR